MGSIRFAVVVDVIDLPIPFLLARSTLSAMGAVLDFEKPELHTKGNRIISSVPTVGGHLSFRWISRNLASVGSIVEEDSVPIFSAEEEPTVELNRHEITKIHVQFGHADVNTTSRILRLAGGKCSLSLLQNIVQT